MVDFQNEGCLIHSLQLVLGSGIFNTQYVKKVHAKSRKIVGHFNHSALACTKLKNIQIRLNKPVHKMIQDVQTRWNSSFYMWERMLSQKEVLSVYANENADCIHTLTDFEWKFVEDLLRLLKPFEEITKALSSNESLISEYIPTIVAIRKYLENANIGQRLKAMQKTLLDSLNKRFDGIFQKEWLTVATFLDPR